jgi:hypothetical protein
MRIDEAQQEIATDWIAAYRKLCGQSVAPQLKSVDLGRARHHPRPIIWEVTMAKGQKRSGREAKKPRKTAPKKPSGGSVGSIFEQAPGVTTKHHSKKA